MLSLSTILIITALTKICILWILQLYVKTTHLEIIIQLSGKQHLRHVRSETNVC